MKTTRDRILDAYRKNPSYTVRQVADQVKCSKVYASKVMKDHATIIPQRSLLDTTTPQLHTNVETTTELKRLIAKFGTDATRRIIDIIEK